jgi:ABC-type glycerol-3-phosphate transport system permease component
MVKHKVKLQSREWIFDSINLFILLIITIATLYPFIYVISVSISNPAEVAAGRVVFLPKGFNLDTYQRILRDPFFLKGYLNTVIYVFASTAISVTITLFTAYPISRGRMTGKNFFTFFITFTMLFSGGLIPLYMVVRSLGLINTRWSVILTGVLAPWNIIIARTFLMNIPSTLEQSASLDGANDLQILFKIFIPLSKPLIAVLTLFHAVWMWNSFFYPFIFLNSKGFWPLQLFLRQIVIEGTMSDKLIYEMEKAPPVELVTKMATITISTLPIIAVYPFLQKYFVKGVMIGALKG